MINSEAISVNSYFIKGYVHKFGDNINTDMITPSQYIERSIEEIAAHVMEGAELGFSKKMKKGDIIVAGKNFGFGSCRETAPLALKMSGVSVIVAEFFARIFYRNCINLGLPLLTIPSTAKINEGDNLEADLLNGFIINNTTGEQYNSGILPDHILKIIEADGLMNHLENQRNKITGMDI